MGQCIGKKSSKYLKNKKSRPDNVKAPQIVIEDVTEEKKSPTLTNELPITNGSIGDHDDDDRQSEINETTIDPELQHFIDEQAIIARVLTQPLPSRVISETPSELQQELDELVFNSLENDQAEDKPIETTPATNSTNT